MTSELWCELAWLGDPEPAAGVVVAIDGDRIAEVQRGVRRPPAGAFALPGLTLPGLANAHSHAFQRALRGRAGSGRETFWSWREAMYAVADRLDPDSLQRIARATYGEMALAGVTCVGEFHYVHHGPGGSPYPSPTAMGDALVAAAHQAGVRLTLIDTCYLQGGIDQPLDDVQRRFGDGDAGAWAERASARTDSPTCRLAAGIHSVRAVDPDAMATVARWAREHGRPLHVHLSEQPAENDACEKAYGCSPTALLERVGALQADLTAVHATHVGPDDVARLGAAGATVCLCPTTERDLADGIGPSEALAAAGCRLAVGSDSQAVVDLLAEAREVELHQRVATGRRGIHPPVALAAMLTSDGYRSLGWPEGGRIAAGSLADLVTVRLDSVRLAGTVDKLATASARPGTAQGSALDAVLLAGAAGDVEHVVVGGQFVVLEGRHVRIDAAAELAAAVAHLT